LRLKEIHQNKSIACIVFCSSVLLENFTVFQDILDAALEEDAELRYFTVEEVKMKTGNKEFIFPLR